jgi:hypothetical protein
VRACGGTLPDTVGREGAAFTHQQCGYQGTGKDFVMDFELVVLRLFHIVFGVI